MGALQALAPERVVYAGTASKTLAPGLRLAWLAVPSDLVDEIVSLRTATSSTIDQLTLARFIESGAYDRHIRRCRLAYRRRRDRLVAAVASAVPGARVSGIAAGLHVVLDLPDGLPEDDVIGRARTAGLALEGLSDYAAASPNRRPALVIGYATPPEHAFSTALARLVAVLSARSTRAR